MDLVVGRTSVESLPDGRIVSWYQGPYAACGVVVTGMEPISCSVNAKSFQQLVELFDDDDDLSLVSTESALLIASKRRRVTLQFDGSPDIGGYHTLQDVFTPSFEIDAATLAREVRIAAQMAAISVQNPILTGMRLVSVGTVLGIESANGSSLFSTATVPIEPATDGARQEIIAPTNNLIDAITALHTEGKVAVGMQGRALVLRAGSAVFKIPTLAGTWPKLTMLRTMKFDRGEMTIPTESIRALVLAAKIYQSGADVTFRPGDEPETIILETKHAEGGQFVEHFEGSIARPYVFDVADLDILSRVSGDTLTIELGETMARITSGSRKTYVIQRSVAAA